MANDSIKKLYKKRIRPGGYIDLNQFATLKENSYVYGSNARFWFRFNDGRVLFKAYENDLEAYGEVLYSNTCMSLDTPVGEDDDITMVDMIADNVVKTKNDKLELDKDMNNKIHGDEAIISTPESKVKVVVIPTDEELMIASDTMDILSAK